MSNISLRPKPSIFLENMRHMGYTLEMAIADIVDNSITAGATQISVRYQPGVQSWIAIGDNGSGMSRQELVTAMQFGSRSMNSERHGVYDLGRFGLGLKVASLSQCRKLTVLSRKDGETSIACWDIDKLEDDWNLCCLSAEDMNTDEGCMTMRSVWERFANSTLWQGEMSNGTIVLWENLDCEYARKPETMSNAMRGVRDYLSLVFHRFLGTEKFAGLELPDINMNINGSEIVPHSPFGSPENPNRRQSGQQVFRYRDAKVTCVPFILPPDRAYKAAERERDAMREGFTATQGFYVYRGGRLISKASWYGLHKKEVATQKLRVLLDIPASLDMTWSVDVKKSQVVLPKVVKDQMEPYVQSWANEARCTRRAESDPGVRVRWGHEHWKCWLLKDEPSGVYGVQVQINEENPLLKSIVDELTPQQMRKLRAYLECLKTSFPVEALVASRGENESAKDEEEREQISAFLVAIGELSLTSDIVRLLLCSMNRFKQENIDFCMNKNK